MPHQDGVSCSQLFFSRNLRDPTLPVLSEKGLKTTVEASKRQISKIKGCKKTDLRPELGKLDPGSLVMIQCPQSKLWEHTGRIVSPYDDNGRSYWVKKHGKKQVIRRNRVFLRPLKKSDNESPEYGMTSHFKGPCQSTQNGEDAPVRRSARLATKKKVQPK